MEILRTPDARFERLPDFPFAPHYLQTADGLRMHYLDEGPVQGRVVLCLHGEPSWSFLQQRAIGPETEEGKGSTFIIRIPLALPE